MNWFEERDKSRGVELCESFLEFFEVSTYLLECSITVLLYHTTISFEQLQELNVDFLPFVHLLTSLFVVTQEGRLRVGQVLCLKALNVNKQGRQGPAVCLLDGAAKVLGEVGVGQWLEECRDIQLLKGILFLG